jgi:RND family efflux transporter MFP subunit
MKKFFSIVAVLVACLVLWGFVTRSMEQPVEVNVTSVEEGAISSYISVSGIIRGTRSVDVISRIAGHITQVQAAEGDRVKAGQLLVQLDDAEASAQVKRADVIMSRSKGKYLELERKLKRMKAVGGTGGASLQAIEDVEAELHDAKAQFEVNQADYELQKISMNLHRVVAPFDGIVARRNAEVGQAVQPALGEATSLFTIVDDSVPYIEANVDASDSGLVMLNGLVQITTDASPGQAWDERILYKAKSVDKQKREGVNTFIVKISVGQQAQKLLIGQQVDLKIRTAYSEHSNKVTHNVIFEGDTGLQVAVIENERVVIRPITIGIQSITHTEIISGLSRQDQIIVGKGPYLKPGTLVRVK